MPLIPVYTLSPNRQRLDPAAMKHLTADTDFWSFATAVYKLDGVAETCLALQDKHGVDVVMLLFCLWTALGRGGCDQGLLSRTADFSRDWNLQVVQPLRAARRWLKTTEGDYGELREAIKADELAAEKCQIEKLEALAKEGGGAGEPVSDPVQAEAAMAATLAGYFELCGLGDNQAARARAARIIDAVTAAL